MIKAANQNQPDPSISRFTGLRCGQHRDLGPAKQEHMGGQAPTLHLHATMTGCPTMDFEVVNMAIKHKTNGCLNMVSKQWLLYNGYHMMVVYHGYHMMAIAPYIMVL